MTKKTELNVAIAEISSGIIVRQLDEDINLELHPGVDREALTAGDDDPMFVNLEVIRTGISNINRRRYNNGVIRQIAEMIVGRHGFLGHPDPSKTSFEFREPHCLFVGSAVDEMEDGTVRALAKAYIFKTSPLREWIPKSIAVGNPLTVSINGSGDIHRDTVNNIIEVLRMNSLDSIDWANPGTEGVSTAQAFSVVKEMKDKEGGIEMKDEIIKGVTIAELQSLNPTVVSQIKEEAKITEMQLKIGDDTKTVKLADVQQVLDVKVAEMQSTIDGLQAQISTAKITEYKNSKIAEQVPEQYRELVAKRISGQTEADIDASITAEMAFIKEIAGDNLGGLNNLPKGKTPQATDTAVEQAVIGLFGTKR